MNVRSGTLRLVRSLEITSVCEVLSDIRRVESNADCPETAEPIYQYWCSKRGSKALPARADIDPTEIPPSVLPYLQLVDVVDDTRPYVYRLNGTREVALRGRDPRGRSVRDAFWGPSAEDALGCYDRVVAECTPLVDPVPYHDRKYCSDFTLFLPLSDDGKTVNMILVYSTYYLADAQPPANAASQRGDLQ